VRNERRPGVEVWSYGIPGTKAIWDIEPSPLNASFQKLDDILKGQVRSSTKTSAILNVLREKVSARHRTPARSGFAVLGHGTEALQELHEILVGRRPHRTSFPTDRPISVVFFTHHTHAVHFDTIKCTKGKVQIRYGFERQQELTVHLAIIPLPRLNEGETDVERNRLPMPNPRWERSFVDTDSNSPHSLNHIVCKPFRFTIE